YEQTGVQRTATFPNFTQGEILGPKPKQAVKPGRTSGAIPGKARSVRARRLRRAFRPELHEDKEQLNDSIEG
ncbi:MAG: hypothetical protein J0H31_22490, partial [Alphaproteobacteria bacterium]|nr:hypothetical protein [Alphaproteobacteria bacterium]